MSSMAICSEGHFMLIRDLSRCRGGTGPGGSTCPPCVSRQLGMGRAARAEGTGKILRGFGVLGARPCPCAARGSLPACLFVSSPTRQPDWFCSRCRRRLLLPKNPPASSGADGEKMARSQLSAPSPAPRMRGAGEGPEGRDSTPPGARGLGCCPVGDANPVCGTARRGVWMRSGTGKGEEDVVMALPSPPSSPPPPPAGRQPAGTGNARHSLCCSARAHAGHTGTGWHIAWSPTSPMALAGDPGVLRPPCPVCLQG